MDYYRIRDGHAASGGVWLRANETEISTALLDFTFNLFTTLFILYQSSLY